MTNIIIALNNTMITSIGVNIFTSFLIFIIGNVVIFEIRKNIFNKIFMENNFKEIHYNSFNEEINYDDYGYPDDGNGFFSQKLNYKDWYRFNQVKRIYDNGIEVLSLYLFIHLVTSLISPKQGLIISILFLTSRVIYILYYICNFHNYIRILGMIISLVCIFWCLIIISSYILFGIN